MHAKILIRNNDHDMITLLETKSLSNKVRNIFNSLRFTQFFMSEVKGIVGGIWVAWGKELF